MPGAAGPDPVVLRPVAELRGLAQEVVESFTAALERLRIPATVHHIGATSLLSGHTKGDVDVYVRVDGAHFPGLVDEPSLRLAIAQPEHWTPTFASFSAPGYALPLGVQVTVAGSPDDFLLALGDRMRGDPELLQRYDEAKVAAADRGADAYWQAKNHFLRPLRPR